MEFFATSHDIPVHISDTGKGNLTIVLLHGYLETLYIFTEFAAALSSKYRVITLDLPGHGLSGSSGDINTMDFCASVVRDVLSVCKVDKAVVGGHSMGGYVALACIKSFPDIFEGLVMLNSTPFPDDPDKKEGRMRQIEIIKSSKLTTLAATSIPRMYGEENLRRLDDKIEETVENCETHDPNGVIACLRGMMERPDSCSVVKEMKQPAIFFFGGDDKFISKETATELLKRFPNVEGAIIPGCGHNSFIEQPEEVLKLLESFLDGNFISR